MASESASAVGGRAGPMEIVCVQYPEPRRKNVVRSYAPICTQKQFPNSNAVRAIKAKDPAGSTLEGSVG